MSVSKEGVLEEMKGKDSVVLNVLSAEEFRKRRIPGSLSLPFRDGGEAFAREAMRRFGKGKLIITYGSNITSHAAIDAAEALRQRGFRAEVYVSGLKEWTQAGLPTEGDP